MTTVWINDVEQAVGGDYVLQRHGDEVRVGRVRNGKIHWLGVAPDQRGGAAMTKPQQNELRRSGKGATDQDSAKIETEVEGTPGTKGSGGPVPPGNRPGWMDREQQK